MTISVSVISSPVYYLGDEIKVDVRLTNIEDHQDSISLPILASGKLKYDIFKILLNRTSVIDYEGLLVKAQPVLSTLDYNESVEFSVFLGREYDIKDLGRYSVCTNSFYDDSVEVDFEVLSGKGQPVKTWLDLESQNAAFKRAVKTFGTHTSYGATDQQFADLKIAHNKALSAFSFINSFGASVSSVIREPYKSVICSSGHHAKNTLEKFLDINTYMYDSMIYVFNSPDCQAGVFGFVWKSDVSKTVYLCEEYNNAVTYPTEANRYDTKSGVIIHEVSHKAVDSKDHFYGYYVCEAHASKCQEHQEPLTCSNADCLQMFAELSYLVKDQHDPDEL